MVTHYHVLPRGQHPYEAPHMSYVSYHPSNIRWARPQGGAPPGRAETVVLFDEAAAEVPVHPPP